MLKIFHRKKEDVQLSTIFNAINHFSDTNKLGQGSFGPVYKVVKFIQIEELVY